MPRHACYTKLGVWGKRYLDIECEGNCLQECIRRRSEVAVWVSPREGIAQEGEIKVHILLLLLPSFIHFLFLGVARVQKLLLLVWHGHWYLSDPTYIQPQPNSQVKLNWENVNKKKRINKELLNSYAYPNNCMNPWSDKPNYKLQVFTINSYFSVKMALR